MVLVWPAVGLAADVDVSAADRWLAEAGPGPLPNVVVRSNRFSRVRAEVVAGALVVRAELPESVTNAHVLASADSPGHWPARDWRTQPMRRAGPGWMAELGVDSVNVPIVYLVAAVEGGAEMVSPMRVAFPRALGMERPSRLFWAFVEGFEQGMDGWQVRNGVMTVANMARSGKSALAVRVPAGRQSASVATTRIRGWLLQESGSDGLAVWLRTTHGEARAELSILAHAFSTNQVISRCPKSFPISTNWSRARLTFDQFPQPPLPEMDLLVISLAAPAGTEVLLDDLHLLGHWSENF